MFSSVLVIVPLLIYWNCRNGDVVPSECLPYPKASDAWIYPVVPGTPEWIAIPTPLERLEACQIPEDRVKIMSSAALVQSWCDLPFNMDIYSSNDYQRPMEYYIAHFSGLRELCQRDDAGNSLMERYRFMEPACVVIKKNDNDKGRYTLSFPIIELLISQDIILDKLTLTEKKDLVAEALRKYESKKKYTEYFGLPGGTAFSLLVCVRTMKNAGYQPFIEDLEAKVYPLLNLFYDTGHLFVSGYDAPEIMSVLNHSYDFIK